MAKKGPFIIKVNVDEVTYTSISKSKHGYNSARMVVKKGDNEYMSISYEWEGDGIPSFAMDLMGFMQANEMKSGEVVKGMEEVYAHYVSKRETGEDE